MTLKTKAIIGAALTLAVAIWGWYTAYSDNDPATQPNTTSVIVAGNDLVNAIKTDEKATTTEAAPEVVK